ncbi:MAG: retroviral-like aspartic protease family protein [Bacteroidales bacterium]|nr:retroviral-like aspartic protease family protein [Bacteroidales bacterium]
MRRYHEIPFQLLDIEGDGFHIMIQGRINGKEANFLIDTGASRSVFDFATMSEFIDDPQFQKKEGITAGVGSSDLESSTFDIESIALGNLEIKHYQAVALDLENIHETYEKINLPKIHGIIGGDVLATHKAVINYRLKKIRIWG